MASYESLDEIDLEENSAVELTDITPPYNQNIRGKCGLCKKFISGRRGANTNFSRHYEQIHPSEYSTFKLQNEKEKQAKKSEKRKRVETPAKTKLTSQKIAAKARASEFFIRAPLLLTEQEKINQRILDYIIADALPLSTVDSYFFQNMLQALNPKNVLFSSKTLCSLIAKDFKKFHNNLKASFGKVSVISLTTDIWSSRHRRSHTFDKIANLIHSIILDYGLTGKVQHIVTDNGSNFVKAMRIYFASPSMASANENNIHETVEIVGSDTKEISEDIISQLAGEDTDVCDSVAMNANIQEIDSYEILSSSFCNDDEDRNIWLPAHIRCAAHTLNLLATTDKEAILRSNSSFKIFFNRALKRVTDLWNKCGRSTQTADLAKQILGTKVLFSLCEQLGIPSVSEEDLEYLFEYVAIMQPISVYLDLLQGEDNCFLGHVLPTIKKIRVKLEGLVLEKGLLEKLDEKFGALFQKDDYILSSISYSKFKFAWISSKADKEHACSRLNSRLNRVSKRVVPCAPSSSNNDPYSFTNDETSPTKDEIDLFLSDKDTNLSMLDRHPLIKSVFIKYNTAVPSSAPVEGLFSIASLVLTARKSRLRDTLLEYMILLKIAKKL
ncbi:Uncharacterized protein APZ42_015711 [Daphnia magna]|uniref:HAT C-terminal dimerisation domain-containing protein n=1 Tax=Daphnia magna TaxID=35525 RepID=A0A162NQM8_9CRUS|nr:Uncharacterized protein APZ42_015711 [Daphnia magna]